MPEIYDWPASGRHVTRSSFWRVPRVARSAGVFTFAPEVQDMGTLWRAEITVEPAAGAERYAFEAFLRALHGGANFVRVHDFDYEQLAPIGTGRNIAEALEIEPGPIGWDTGVLWDTGAGWEFTGELETAETLTAGASILSLKNGAPGEEIIAPGDTIEIGGEILLAAGSAVPDEVGRVTVAIDPHHQVAAEAGVAVTVGSPYRVPMMLLNVDAGANATDASGLTVFNLKLIEVPGADG